MTHVLASLVLAATRPRRNPLPRERRRRASSWAVDCSKPLTVSLPDDVLTECEQGKRH